VRAAALAAATVLVFLLQAMTPARANDLRDTPHNLARHGGAAGEEGLCIFCHTPSASEGAAMAPRWQRALEGSFSFAVYDDVGSGLTGRVGSHSVVCLSCHDALQAQSISAPTAVSISPERSHPVGVPYSGPLDGAPRHGVEFRPASRAMVDGRPVWWVSRRGPTATRARSDLPLFSRNAPDREDPVPFIECGTCHDPHTAAPLFLRLAGRRGELCLTCHDN